MRRDENVQPLLPSGLLINANTRIKVLLDANQEEVIHALIKLNKNFSKLKNPLLRNLFARRVTIADACKIAGSPIADFMNSMKEVGFKIISDNQTEQKISSTEPEFIKNGHIVELDVRPVLAENQDPLKLIMNHITALEKGQCLKLINTFEPIPLISLLADKGFSHFTEFLGADMVITYFQKNKSGKLPVFEPAESEIINDENQFDKVLSQFEGSKIKYADVRELEMPKPMLLIMENIESLVKGEVLFVYHKKRPLFLLPELEKKGYRYHFNDTSAGGVNMLIYRP